MASRVMNNFNALKAKGLTDEQAIKQSFGLVAKGRKKIRAADKKKLKRKTRHSPAGLKHLASLKRKKKKD